MGVVKEQRAGLVRELSSVRLAGTQLRSDVGRLEGEVEERGERLGQV